MAEWTSVKTWPAGYVVTADDMNTYVSDNTLFLKTNILLETPVELTIDAGGEVTLSRSNHTIDTFGDGATDNLDTINGGGEGRIIILRAAHTDRTVVLRDGIDNLDLGGDITLDDDSKTVLLIYSNGAWRQLTRFSTDTDEKVKIDAAAAAGYLGAAFNDGVLRTGAGLSYADGGNFITLTVDVGIADDKIVQIDDADAAANDYCKLTANGVVGRSYAEVLSDLSGQASAAFDLNGQDLLNGGVIFLTEQAAAEADIGGKGQIWVKTGAPNTLWFTDEDGTDTQLGAGGGANHNILDGSVHLDSVADAVTRGSIIYGNATPKWDELVVGAANTFLGSDGTDVMYRTAAQVRTSINVADGADVTGANAPQAHAASHAPQTGGDALTCDTPNELASVQAGAEGTADYFARSDHDHQIQHSIADNHLVTIDGDPNADEVTFFTASGLAGKTEAEFKTAFSLTIGTDVLAEQTIGIADNNLVEIDSATVAAAEWALFTANGLESKTNAELVALIESSLARNRNFILTAAGGWPSTTNGCAEPDKTEYTTNDQDLWSLDFDTGSDEFAQWTIVLPDDYNAGTVTAIFFWTTVGGGAAETVKWYLQGRAYADNDAIDQAWGTAVGIEDTWIADGDVHITSATAVITIGGGPAAGELCQFRIYRDVSEDDLGVDAKLLAVKIIYTGK